MLFRRVKSGQGRVRSIQRPAASAPVVSRGCMVLFKRDFAAVAAIALLAAIPRRRAGAGPGISVRPGDDAGGRAHAGHPSAFPRSTSATMARSCSSSGARAARASFRWPATPSSSFPARWRTAPVRPIAPRPTTICSQRFQRCRDLAAAGRFRHADRLEAAALPDQYELSESRALLAAASRREPLSGSGPRYFHTDLSASQRWPFSSLASASIAPPSSSGSSPSSSVELDSSARFSFGARALVGRRGHRARRPTASACRTRRACPATPAP